MAAVAASMNRGASRRLTPAQEAAQAKQRHGRERDLDRIVSKDRTLVRLDWFKQGLLDRDVIALATALAGNECLQQLYIWCVRSTACAHSFTVLKVRVPQHAEPHTPDAPSICAGRTPK